jgi:energy-coupling factor transporter transmembrane protein EcfT
VIGAFTVWADIKRRSEQIIIARFSRGFISKRNFLNTAKQFPHVLVPLIIGILRTSIERSETWIRWNIINLISTKRTKYEEYSVTVNVAIALITVLCLTIGIIYP